ncbi:Uncharacterized protein PECH_000479 [Penicillium ucsense]|uniref:MHD domain-containing protein n=1 Tax=Penicillium ucsense TaxID=2839758 RepID=A0A8J8WL75_9EURO|nr:Uncharacterized protein PECM_004129 [Penicillium ucsense]KAF7733514.1 Uncharacterized protein PECH_000479 [Penicillium ucsense]
MELSRQEYAALLATLHPTQASTVLTERVRLINKINSDIADFLQERRRVEETYAQGLRKLASRPQLDNGAALGIFQIPWQRIINATETLATSHETLATKIEEDVERSLREYSTKNAEMQSMPSIQNNLASLAKNVEAAQKKVDKAKGKGTKGASSLSGAIAAAEEVNQQWESRAPFVYEQLQAADESRLNHLRDLLTQLETHELDHVERCREAAESCLNVLLNVETADEIKTFAAKMAGNRAILSPRISSRQNSHAEINPASSTAAPSTAGSETATAPPAAAPSVPTPRVQDDAASQHSGRSEPPTVGSLPHSSTAPEPVPRHTPLGGLRRLGTVMNRRKSVITPTGGGFDRKAEKKHRSPFSSFMRSDSSREAQIPESPPRTADRPGTALTEESSLRNESVSHDNDAHGAPAPAPAPAPVPAPGFQQEISASNENTLRADERPASNGISKPTVDSEGFTERPQSVDEITRAQREASALEDSGVNLTIRDQPIFEDESQARKAMDDMANTLRMRAPQPGMRRNAGTIRGRRDVRNTVFVPNAGAELAMGSAGLGGLDHQGPSSPIRNATSPTNTMDDHAISDTTSVRSGHTAHSLGPSIHPELHEPGLNASIIETVSAWFSEGNVTKSSVVGELALAHNPQPDNPIDKMVIHLDNFASLEKVAANPSFVHASSAEKSEDKSGEYEIQLGSISRSMPTVAFKYQVHIDPANPSAYSPVIFKPAWNVQENQASAIIFYSLNPAFISATSSSIILKNVALTVTLDIASEDEVTKQPRESVARATSAVMYPNSGAVFRRKTSSVVWKIQELEVKAPGSGGEDGKFLVRFTTATPGPRKGNVEARFEYTTTETGSRLGISCAPTKAGDSEIDPFADDGKPSGASSWEAVPTTRKLVAGKYVSA